MPLLNDERAENMIIFLHTLDINLRLAKKYFPNKIII